MGFQTKNSRLIRGVQRLCSCLAHWSPIFGEVLINASSFNILTSLMTYPILTQVEYLPRLAKPFVALFGRNELASFETVMSVLMLWGHGWQVYTTLPAVHYVNEYRLIAFS